MGRWHSMSLTSPSKYLYILEDLSEGDMRAAEQIMTLKIGELEEG